MLYVLYINLYIYIYLHLLYFYFIYLDLKFKKSYVSQQVPVDGKHKIQY